MATRKPTSPSSGSSPSSSEPSDRPDSGDVEKYLGSKDAQKLGDWVRQEYQRARQARTTKQMQWYTNMSYFYGQQWVEATSKQMPEGFRDRLTVPRQPYYKNKKTVNRTRSFVRSEISKFISATPQIAAVPGSGEDEDQRAALAAEQAWQSMADAGKLDVHVARAFWWAVVTGNGFVKSWWDTSVVDRFSGQPGVVRYSAVTPFHLFAPDLREQDIEDQPFLINANVKTLEWAEMFFGERLSGHKLQASTTSANSILEDGRLNLQAPSTPDSVVIFETWVKPGATKLLPEGGLVMTVDDFVVDVTPNGFPYEHGMYPYTKFEHIPTATFYADSPLVDTNELQKEYNQLRSEISDAGKKMAKPQLLAQRGAVVPSRITNEPGLVIEYRPGYPPPTPLQLTPLPQYYVEQQDRILLDWEDITGEKEVTRGSAPAGVTAGTAINYLQEAANQFLTTQFSGIEQGRERLAVQSVSLFVQYVDLPRKVKTIGADGSFDVLLLSGSDIADSTDLRAEAGSGIPKSRAAQEAKIMDMYSLGLIPQDMALKLMEVGGVQKVLDTLSVAEKQAQRENTKMKNITEEDVQQHEQEHEQQMLEIVQQHFPVQSLEELPEEVLSIIPPPGPVIPVNDYDIHAQHIDTHNRFRMGQEYEMLPEHQKSQFEKHVKAHEEKLMQAQMANFLQQIPGDGTEEGGEQPQPGEEPLEGIGEVPDPMSLTGAGPGATMAANGAVPDMTPEA